MAGWQANVIGGENGCPAVLFHGTKREHIASIRDHGLAPADPHFWCRESGQHSGDGCTESCEPDAVCRTDDLGQAVANSDSIAWETSTFDLDCLLVIDVTGLPVYRLSFYRQSG